MQCLYTGYINQFFEQLLDTVNTREQEVTESHLGHLGSGSLSGDQSDDLSDEGDQQADQGGDQRHDRGRPGKGAGVAPVAKKGSLNCTR